MTNDADAASAAVAPCVVPCGCDASRFFVHRSTLPVFRGLNHRKPSDDLIWQFLHPKSYWFLQNSPSFTRSHFSTDLFLCRPTLGTLPASRSRISIMPQCTPVGVPPHPSLGYPNLAPVSDSSAHLSLHRPNLPQSGRYPNTRVELNVHHALKSIDTPSASRDDRVK